MTEFSIKKRLKAYCKVIWRMKALAIALCVSVLAIIYWGLIASDRYVSEARVLIQRTDMAASQAMDFSALLAGGDGISRADQMLLRDRLLSVDMLLQLDKDLNLREHYSSHDHDILSRMFFHDASLEFFTGTFSRASAWNMTSMPVYWSFRPRPTTQKWPRRSPAHWYMKASVT